MTALAPRQAIARPDPVPSERTSWVSALAVLLGAAVVLAVAYGPHVLDGGFYNDDWTDTGFMFFEKDLGTVLTQVHGSYAHRPLYVLYTPALHWLAGDNPWALNTWSLVLAAAFATAMWAVLRRYRLPALPAAAAAFLAILFPFADSNRLWAASSHMTLSLTLFAAGLLVSLRAFEREGSRALRLHAAGVVLYVASLAIFEVTAGFIAASGLLYLLRVRGRAVFVRWAVDAVAAVLFVAIFTVGQQTAYERLGLAEQVENAGRIADQAWTLLAWAAVPFGDARRDLTTLALLVVAGAGVAVWRLAAPPLAAAARRWLLVAAAGVLVMALGYLPFVPADPVQYQPLLVGGQNRVNMAASPGYAIVLVALAQLAGLAVAAVARLRPAAAAAVGLALAAVVGVGMARDVAEDRDAWARSWDGQQAVLAAVQRQVPDPPRNAEIMTFGHAGAEQEGVPLLGGRYDMTHALRLTYRRPDVSGAAVLINSSLDCRARDAVVVGGASGGYRGEYGRLTFVDVMNGVTHAIGSQAQCRRFFPGMPRGPINRVDS
jgi:hypothetical protein